MAAVFTPAWNLIAKLGLLALTGVVAVGLLWWFWWPTTDYVRQVGWAPEQPVPFSHQHHVLGLGLDCRFCHASVENAANAGLPPTFTCMTCHSQIWTNAALLEPVRESLLRNQPIAWHQVYNLPQYVYFNHAIHIAKGVGCESCHGNVADQSLTTKSTPLTMAFCLSCHRNPGPQLRPPDAIFNTEWHRAKDTPSAAQLLAFYHIGNRNITECSICHR